MAKPRVFLDTSIFIAALLSSQGGSFYILNSYADRVHFQINEYVFEEIDEVLKKKFSSQSGLRSNLFLLLGMADVEILPNSTKSEVYKLINIISEKDAPILACAITQSDYLLTLDNEFFQDEIINTAKLNGLIIFKPKDFIGALGR